ncbi:ROK family protein [Arachnia propionica]|uniref:ROK family protein n=1 Tax=Arachnia propionica TaxID=1750 RepID=A0A3P1TD76_9ACTN|nr:ROK family protein [Arachnia propionica]MDO5081901.1 ROK family protein [Arachnia propionica]RRD07248.1 ROK family protein [Arachnia propionica]
MVTAGIDIGGTKTTAVLTDADGTVLASRTITSGRGGPALLDGAARLLGELELSSGLHARAVGVGVAGVIDPGSGKVLAASGTFPDWAGRYPGNALSERLGRPVRLVNDVNAFLGGEVRWGVLRGARDALAIMLGTGVGGAFLLDGQLRGGPRGSAGEIGHTPGYSQLVCTCGGIGHLETLASGRSLGLRYAELTGVDGLGGREVAELARSGDAAAGDVFTRAAEALAQAVVVATTLLDLTDVVVGGGVSAAWDLLEPPLIASLTAAPPVTVPIPRVHRASLSSTALGAAALAQSTRIDTIVRKT